MTRTPYWAVVTSSLVLGAALYFWNAQRAKIPAPDLEARLASTEARLASMQSQIRSIDGRPATTREVVTRVAGQPTDPESESQRESGPGAQPAVVVASESVDPVERARTWLETERRDPVWAPSTERALQTAYHEGAMPGSQLREVRCQSSLCRLRFSHEGEDAIPAFRHGLAFGNPIPDGTMLVQPRLNESGELESEVFVARSGQGLGRR